MPNFPFLPRGKHPAIEVLFLTRTAYLSITLSGSILGSNCSFTVGFHTFFKHDTFDLGIDLCTCFNNGRNKIIFIDKNVPSLKCLNNNVKTGYIFCRILVPCNAMVSLIFDATASVAIFPEKPAKRLLSH